MPLLVHILKLVVEPNETQLPDIQRLDVTVAKLEQVTWDALSVFFQESKNNEAKRPYLKELFKVSKMEESFRRGEISGHTDLYVMPADRLPGEEDEDDEDEDPVAPRFQPDSNLSILIRGQSPTTSIPGAAGPPQPMITLPAPQHYGSMSTLAPEPSPYMEIDDNGATRRPSMYHGGGSEYGQHPGMYPTHTAAPSWHQTTTAPPTGPIFGFAHNQGILPLPSSQPQTQSAHYATHLDVHLGQSQFMGSPMEGLPGPNGLFRGGSGSPPHGHGHGYGREFGH